MFYLPQSKSNLCHGTFKENKFQSAAINRNFYLVIQKQFNLIFYLLLYAFYCITYAVYWVS